MRVESYVMAELLHRMEQQCSALRPYTVDIATALSNDEHSVALAASAELHRTLKALVTTKTLLQDHVVARDGMGQLGGSVSELTLRARGLVLTVELKLLDDALREPEARARAREWFGGRFQSITELIAFVRVRLSEIHAIWMPYRRDQVPCQGMTALERGSVYRTMLRVAQRRLSDLQREVEFARFLARGAAANDLPEIHLSCKRILHVLRPEGEAVSSTTLALKTRAMLNDGEVEQP